MAKKVKKPLSVKQRKQRMAASAKASGAMQGNAWWQLRSKHGVDAIFTDPNILAEEAAKYFSNVDANPEYKSEAKVIGGKVKMVRIPYKQPYTVSGMGLFLRVGESWWRDFARTKTGKSEGFPAVIDAINQTIYTQKFNGAASGFFNANIISRDLGLRDNIDATTNGKDLPPAGSMVLKVYNIAPPLSNSEDEVDTNKKL